MWFCARINLIMKNKIPNCNLWFVFQTYYKISNFFASTDRIPVFLRSGIVSKFQCGGYNATYYRKTYNFNYNFNVIILMSKCVNIWEICYSPGKEIKPMRTLTLNIFFSKIIWFWRYPHSHYQQQLLKS